jgi:N-carbamoylputrescine amidase
MQGHAAANMVPVIAANRIGRETGVSAEITFYGSSFIADETGAIVAEAPRDKEAVITASFDTEALRLRRFSWGLYRDRRPDLYGGLLEFGEGP